MKTTHQLAQELLALDELPIWHFDPSLAGWTEDDPDPSLSEPRIEVNRPEKKDIWKTFVTICGDRSEIDLEPAHGQGATGFAIENRRGEIQPNSVGRTKEEAWSRFLRGVTGLTRRDYERNGCRAVPVASIGGAK